jgi:hypothetical protein
LADDFLRKHVTAAGMNWAYVQQRFEDSEEWAEYRRELLSVAEARANGAVGAPSPIETATQKTICPQKWDEVEIFMPNEFEAQITFPNRPALTRGFEDMGFADGRGRSAKKPNQSWGLLLRFARFNGRIQNAREAGLADWGSVEQRVWALNDALKRHFGIPDCPIRYVKKAYETTFKIKANPSQL